MMVEFLTCLYNIIMVMQRNVQRDNTILFTKFLLINAHVCLYLSVTLIKEGKFIFVNVNFMHKKLVIEIQAIFLNILVFFIYIFFGSVILKALLATVYYDKELLNTLSTVH